MKKIINLFLIIQLFLNISSIFTSNQRAVHENSRFSQRRKYFPTFKDAGLPAPTINAAKDELINFFTAKRDWIRKTYIAGGIESTARAILAHLKRNPIIYAALTIGGAAYYRLDQKLLEIIKTMLKKEFVDHKIHEKTMLKAAAGIAGALFFYNDYQNQMQNKSEKERGIFNYLMDIPSRINNRIQKLFS